MRALRQSWTKSLQGNPEQPVVDLVVGLVGPCSSGKSTLAVRLRAAGYVVREIRQEHSVVPTMWQRITSPDVLVYLDVSLAAATVREGLSSPSSWWVEEREVRLAHAREHCDIYIDTTDLTPDEIASRVLEYLEQVVTVDRNPPPAGAS